MEGLAPGALDISGDAAHYVRDVLRLGAGASLALFDGVGSWAPARITDVSATHVRFAVGALERQPGPSCVVTIGLATPKGERADWALEKLTELGVARIVWLDCARGVVKPKEGKRERWQRVAAAAARQCGRADVPSIEGPLSIAEAARLDAAVRYVGDFSGEHLVRGTAASAVLLIGPEGGFTAEELVELGGAGYTSVRLGPYTLRVETAAAAGAAILLST